MMEEADRDRPHGSLQQRPPRDQSGPRAGPAVARARKETDDAETLLIVTADHECGGLGCDKADEVTMTELDACLRWETTGHHPGERPPQRRRPGPDLLAAATTRTPTSSPPWPPRWASPDRRDQTLRSRQASNAHRLGEWKAGRSRFLSFRTFRLQHDWRCGRVSALEWASSWSPVMCCAVRGRRTCGYP